MVVIHSHRGAAYPHADPPNLLSTLETTVRMTPDDVGTSAYHVSVVEYLFAG